MKRSLPSYFLALFAFCWGAIALPTYMQDEYPPDLITVVNQLSGGGQYYIKSFVEPGQDGDLVIQGAPDSPSYSKEHEIFAPNFFVRGGDLFSVTNSTHILQVVALNMTDHAHDRYNAINHSDPDDTGHEEKHKTRKFRYKLQLVDPKKARKNTGIGEGKYSPGTWSWFGPILLYSFGPQHKQLKGSLFYSCGDGVYLDVHSGPPPAKCEAITLHARNVLRLR